MKSTSSSPLQSCCPPKATKAIGTAADHGAHEMKIFLIRHGETEWSISGQHTGRTDLPLTACGENQARRWAAQFRYIPFSHVFTSPLLRAQQTCELAGVREIAVIEPDLLECDYGDYEGVTTAEIRETQPDWNLFRDGSPNGDSPAQVSARADRLIAKLRTMDGNIALFSHGHFGAALATRWIGLPIAEAEHFRLTTASLSILGHDSHHPAVPIIESLNSAPTDAYHPGSLFDASERSNMKQRSIERWENEGGEVPDELPAPQTPVNANKPVKSPC